MKKLLVVVLTALALINEAGAGSADRKPTIAIYNLGSHPILNDSVAGIKAALAEKGYRGEKVKILEVSANFEMDKLNAFAKEVLNAKPDVIVPISTPVTQAVVKEASEKQKIVFSTVTNPSDVGMDKKPKNMTGVSDVVNYKANFDLILKLFPKAKTIGIPYNAGERNSQFGIEQVKKLAEKRRIQLRLVAASNSQEVIDAVRSLVGDVDVIYVGSDNTVVSAIGGLTKIAYERRIPVIASDSGSVRDGALAAVSVDYEKVGRQAGNLVAEVLKTGKMPGEIKPVVFIGDTLMLNLKAARSLSYEFSKELRARAIKIID